MLGLDRLITLQVKCQVFSSACVNVRLNLVKNLFLRIVVTVWTIVSVIIIMQYSVIFNSIDSLCISREYSLACLLHVFSMCYPGVFKFYKSVIVSCC